jgi:hypothetical protein
MLGYLELGVVVHPPQGRRSQAGGVSAIGNLQGLVHQGDSLEVVFFPVPEQVGSVAQGSGLWSPWWAAQFLQH